MADKASFFSNVRCIATICLEISDLHCLSSGRSAVNGSGTYLVCSNLFDGFDVYCLDTQQYLRTLPAHNVENVSLSLSFVHTDVEAVFGTANGAVKVVNILSGDMTADLHHDCTCSGSTTIRFFTYLITCVAWDMIQTVVCRILSSYFSISFPVGFSLAGLYSFCRRHIPTTYHCHCFFRKRPFNLCQIMDGGGRRTE